MVFATQREAVAAAQAAVRKTGGELTVRTPGGRAKKSFTLGQRGHGEAERRGGAALSPRARRTLARLDLEGAGSEARRTAIADAWRKAKP